MSHVPISELSPKHIRQLCDLYRAEWWTESREQSDVECMIENSSLTFGFTTSDGDLVGFARVLTDRVYKALIFDVIVSSDLRKSGLGAELMKSILAHPDLSKVKHFELYCLPELEGFYEQWEFSADVGGVSLMRRTET